MRIDVITVFPEMFLGPLDHSMVKRARDGGLIHIQLHDLREFATDKHRRVDDAPFSGGAGMLMKPEPIFNAVESILEGEENRPPIILMSPQGSLFKQQDAKELAKHQRLVIVCGHYEGIDERVREGLVTHEFSIGDYVLTGGELPAMVLIDAVSRMIPGVLGAPESAIEESFFDSLLEYPQYTRPREFRGMMVPEILLSGNHEEIRKWKRRESLRRTFLRRPDLLDAVQLTCEDKEFLKEIINEYKEP